MGRVRPSNGVGGYRLPKNWRDARTTKTTKTTVSTGVKEVKPKIVSSSKS